MTDTITFANCQKLPVEKSNSLIARCSIDDCRKKVGIMPIVCRCNAIFCSKHRIPESHNCTFDYKTSGKEILQKQNPNVSFEKIVKL